MRRLAALIGLVLLAGTGAAVFDSALAVTARPWTSAHSDPPESSGAGLAYDEATRQLVLFGGERLNGYAGATRIWNGRGWSAPSGPQPAARENAGMVYDAASRQVVLFGGCCDMTNNNFASFGDTWVWNGRSWRRIAGAGPPPRESASTVYDPAIGQVLLFGGCCAGGSANTPQDPGAQSPLRALNDTWAWNGSRWRRVATAGPPGRQRAAMAYDPATHQVVMVGGCCQASTGKPYGDTWTWTPAGWRQGRTEIPPRENASLVYDGLTQQMVLFGGDNGTNWYGPTPGSSRYLADTWTWDGRSWRFRQTGTGGGGPGPRTEAAAAYDPDLPVATAAGWRRGAVVLFGGFNANGSLSDLWIWNGGRWVRGAGRPSRRQQAAAAYDPATGQLVLFGGLASPLTYLGDTWTWDGKAWSFRAGPGTQQAAPIAYDGYTRQLLLFGDYDPSAATLGSGHTWSWSGGSWAEVSTTGPPAREGAVMAYDAASRQLVLFGGDQWSSTFLGDTWTWNGSRWTQVAGSGPPARTRASMVYDAATRQLVLFGGQSAAVPLGDTWTWDGARWTPAAGPGPTPQTDASMVYDAATRQVVLFDDRGDAPTDQTWLWNGNTWTPAAPSPSSATMTIRGQAGLAYDSTHRQVVLFGGGAGEPPPGDAYFGDTWTWNGTTWSQAATVGPVARDESWMVDDPAAGRVLLYGGVRSAPQVDTNRGFYWPPQALTDTWAWDGHAWTRLPDGPVVYDSNNIGVFRPAPMAYDAATRQVVMFGFERDTWTW